MPGAITIATNMAGRGTDIQLGGNAKMRIERELAGLEGEERAAKREGDPRRGRFLQGEGARRRRPLRARHRAPRIPPHRQPAARPFGPPGRSGPLQVLPVAPGRPDAHLRLRPHGRHAAEARPEGGRGHHPSVDQQGHRAGAGEGRGAQLRHPQEHPEIRQRHERPAQGRVRAAQGVHGGRERARHHRRHAPRRHRRHRLPRHPRERLCRAMGRRGPEGERRSTSSTSTCRSRNGRRRRASPTTRSASASPRRPTRPMPSASRRTRPRS